MKRIITAFTLLSCILFGSCNTTPEKYFDVAVLNSNMLDGFAGDGQFRELASPSVKMGENGAEVLMKSREMLEQKIEFLEEDYKEIKGLSETAETKEMLQASAAIYEYVLPVYKNEYQKLATAFDERASKNAIDSAARSIHDKYYDHYDALYNKLISIGKAYAEKHSIKVNWNVGA